MNHTCQGDYISPLKLYRCLLNGMTIKLDKIPEYCPICDRKVYGRIHNNAKIRTVIIEEIQLEGCFNDQFLGISRTECNEREITI